MRVYIIGSDGITLCMGIDAELYFDNIQADWGINPELSVQRRLLIVGTPPKMGEDRERDIALLAPAPTYCDR
jgi:hypothetical protein